jgi:hypothetical protein
VETDNSRRPFTPLHIELGDHVLTVRQASEADVPEILALLESLSPEDTHRRFFSMFKVTERFVLDWVRRCHDHGLGLVVVADDGGARQRVVADAGYVVLASGNAEFAITVAPDRRGWLGPFLLDVLVGEAAGRAVPNLEADVLAENATMLALARHRGFATDGDTDYTVIHVIIGTDGHGPRWPPVPRGPKLLVEKLGARWDGRARAIAAGFEVVACGVRATCPALRGRPCPLAAGADAVLVALPAVDPRRRRLLDAHGRLHGAAPVPLPSSRPDHEEGDQLVAASPTAPLCAELAALFDRA